MARGEGKHRIRKGLQRLLLAVGSLAVVLCIAEIVARIAEPGPFTFFDRSPYVHDATFGHVHKAGFEGAWDGSWYAIDSRGMRGADWRPTYAENEYRVLAVGDSSTFGKGVLERDSWPRQFERVLRDSLGQAIDVHVANAGVNGYAGSQYLEVLRRNAPEIKPQLVVMAFSLNDFPNVVERVDNAVWHSQENLRAKVPADVRDALGRFALFRWMRSTYYEINRERDWQRAEELAGEVSMSSPHQEKRFARAKERMSGVVEEARKIGAHVLIVLLPYESQVYLEAFEKSPVERLRALCDELGVPFLELVEDFRAVARESQDPPRLFLRGDRYHPTAEGYRIVAEGVFRAVRSQGWLPITH